MAISSKHPIYAAKLADWKQMFDTYSGERTVKSQRTLYLPATTSMINDGMTTADCDGSKAYNAYLTRAVYHDYVKQAVEAMVGIIHKKPANIELPDKLKPLLDSCTLQGDTLSSLLRKITEAQLVYGRYGILVEIPDGEGPNTLPYLAPYSALNIINWSDRKEFVVLQEIQNKLKTDMDFEWEEKVIYRVCAMYEGKYVVQTVTEDNGSFDPLSAISPEIASKSFDEIPFVFINHSDLTPEPDDPPLLGLSNAALAIYRGEADYRQSLFQQAQETLVVIGCKNTEGKYKVGANSVLELPKDADAKYIGVSADGLSEMRESIKADKLIAGELSTKLIDQGSSDQSGEALRIRMASKTANLTRIAKTSAEGLKQALYYCADIIGASREQIKVEIDTDFAEPPMTGQELLSYVSAVNQGAPLSKSSLHNIMKQRDLTQLDFEAEMEAINNELQ